MKDSTKKLLNAIPSFIENSGVNITLTGWPAAVSILGLCTTVSVITIANIKNKLSEDDSPISKIEKEDYKEHPLPEPVT